jgi:hypothetical protein
MRKKLHQAFRFKHPKGFPERGSADADLLANLSLNEALAADQNAFVDHFADLARHVLVKDANIDPIQQGTLSFGSLRSNHCAGFWDEWLTFWFRWIFSAAPGVRVSNDLNRIHYTKRLYPIYVDKVKKKD